MELIERNRLVEENMPMVRRMVFGLLGAGVSAAIERDDLIQEGYLELLRTIDAHPHTKMRSLKAAVGMNVWRTLVRFRARENAGGVTMAPPGLTMWPLDAYLTRFEGQDASDD